MVTQYIFKLSVGFEAWMQLSCYFLRQETLLDIVSTQVCKWVSVKCCWGFPCDGPIHGGVAILLVASWYMHIILAKLIGQVYHYMATKGGKDKQLSLLFLLVSIFTVKCYVKKSK